MPSSREAGPPGRCQSRPSRRRLTETVPRPGLARVPSPATAPHAAGACTARRPGLGAVGPAAAFDGRSSRRTSGTAAGRCPRTRCGRGSLAHGPRPRHPNRPRASLHQTLHRQTGRNVAAEVAECAGSPRRAARCSCCPSRRPWPGWAPYGPDGEDAVDEDGTDYWRLCSALAGDVWVWPVAGVEGLAFDEGRSPTTFLPGSGVLGIDLAPGDYLVSTAAWFASSSHRFPDMALTRLSPRPR